MLADNAAQKMNQEYEMLTLKQSEEVEANPITLTSPYNPHPHPRPNPHPHPAQVDVRRTFAALTALLGSDEVRAPQP